MGWWYPFLTIVDGRSLGEMSMHCIASRQNHDCVSRLDVILGFISKYVVFCLLPSLKKSSLVQFNVKSFINGLQRKKDIPDAR